MKKLNLQLVPEKEISRPRWFHWRTLPNKKELILILSTSFRKRKRVDPNQRQYKKESYKLVSYMNTDAKILSKTSVNRIWQFGLFQGCQAVASWIWKPINTIYYREEKSHDNINWWCNRKSRKSHTSMANQFLTKKKKAIKWKNYFSTVLEYLNNHKQKIKSWPIPHTLYKNYLKF